MQTKSTVLSGDIGGTKTRLAIIEVNGTQLNTLHEVSYLSQNYPTFDELVANFLQGMDIPSCAGFGIAGPVQGRVVQTTNLPWQIDASALQRQFGFARCVLLNDLEATACGLPALGETDLFTLHEGAANTMDNQAVIAAGTGLGEAGLFWNGHAHQPFATEGGHTSFTASDDREFALLKYLQQRYEHVSWERVVSGMGIVALYEFMCHYHHATVPAWLNEEMEKGDVAAAIANAAMSERDELCVETLDWFLQLYGAEAGNLALKMMSRGGVYLGGGIAPKILSRLQNGIFLKAFFSKGRMRPLLEAMPVKVILNDKAALYGAALFASHQ
ncbi:MAG: glucokinase [Gallionella sp.]